MHSLARRRGRVSRVLGAASIRRATSSMFFADQRRHSRVSASRTVANVDSIDTLRDWGRSLETDNWV